MTVVLGVSAMQAKVLETKKVTTRFGERLVLTVETPEGGEDEVWVNDPDYPVTVGDSVTVESSNGKLKLAKGSKKTSKSSSSSGNNGDAVAELVNLFKSVRDALPDESSEAIAKLAITLFLRK